MAKSVFQIRDSSQSNNAGIRPTRSLLARNVQGSKDAILGGNAILSPTVKLLNVTHWVVIVVLKRIKWFISFIVYHFLKISKLAKFKTVWRAQQLVDNTKLDINIFKRFIRIPADDWHVLTLTIIFSWSMIVFRWSLEGIEAYTATVAKFDLVTT